jgi:4-alpha-glucanotransferase
LLHPTSLPGPFGIGDLGPAAYRFVDFLADAGQTYWQVLPLGPTGYGESPYQALSSFAGNPLLISPELLVERGALSPATLDGAPRFAPERVDFTRVVRFKRDLLDRVLDQFTHHATKAERQEFETFAQSQRHWLDDFALYMALKEEHSSVSWTAWEPNAAARTSEALTIWAMKLRPAIERHTYAQYLFFQQWAALRAYANKRGVRIIGDVPIFAAHDSADCWANRKFFALGHDGEPTFVAGVPPDYFSATGQLWGNPVYRWDIHEAEGFSWWIDRLRMALSLVDVLRLDHFRGFAGYWAIPADAPTAVTGRWEPGPGAALFLAVQRALGALPFIAEDLGVITPDVVALRDEFGFPGMKVLQFAFGGDARNPDLPHSYTPHTVVYTGTHDNDTTAGWFGAAAPNERKHALDYLHSDGKDIVWDLIRLAYAAVAETAIIPLQDLLGLGSEARMNLPGSLGGNWDWRYQESALTEDVRDRLLDMAVLYGRAPEPASSQVVEAAAVPTDVPTTSG